MAITTTKNQFKFEFALQNGGNSATTRSFTIETVNGLSSGLSAAQSLQSVLAGSVSSPFSVIDPTTFVQPTGWRDNDPNEPPWTTASVTLFGIETKETFYSTEGGGGGGGDDSRNLRITGADDDQDPEVNFYFDGDVTPIVTALVNGTWQNVTVSKVGSGGQYYFEKSVGMTQGTVYLPPVGNYGAYTQTFEIAY